MECFHVPVRFYSTYLESIAAPAGFETQAAPLDSNKWQHLPPNYPIKLRIRLENDSSYSIQVVWNERVLDKMKISLGDNRRLVQFTAKSPSISCKYIIWQDSEPFMRRFQITLNGDDDFIKLCTILRELRLVIKPARGVVPQEKQPQGLKSRQESQTGTNHTLTFRVRDPPGASAATKNTNLSLTGKSLLDKKYFTQAENPHPNYLLASQAPAGPLPNPLSVQVQDYSVVFNSTSRKESPPPFLNDGLLQKACDQSMDSMTDPAAVYQQEQIRCKATARTPTHEEVDVILEDVQENSQQANIAQHGVSNAAIEQILKPQKGSSSHKITNKSQESEIHGEELAAVEEPLPKVRSHKYVSASREPSTCNSIENNVLLGLEEVRVNTDQNNKKTINIHKDRTKVVKGTKSDPITGIKIRPPGKIRLSRRTIKEKLKDENFMKWVSKVEETLREMAS